MRSDASVTWGQGYLLGRPHVPDSPRVRLLRVSRSPNRFGLHLGFGLTEQAFLIT